MLKKITIIQKVALVLFGFCLTIVILEIGLRLSSFVVLFTQEHRNLQSIKQQGSFRIMCLGESTTQGQYPPYLEKILNQSNIKMKFNVIDNGLAGTKTVAILSQLEANLDKYQPNMVVAMMGINDRGGNILDEGSPSSKLIMALRSFKVYKLARLLWLRMAANNESSCVALGRFYFYQEKLTEAEQAFNKALKFNPKNDSVCVELGRLYQYQGKSQHKFAGPEEAFKKAIELNPNNEFARTALGQFYMDSGRPAESEQILREAIMVNPKDYFAYVGLGRLYLFQGRLTESEQVLKKVLEFNPDDASAFGGLAAVYSEMGDHKLFDIYAGKASNLTNEYYELVTVGNYHKLKQILDKRNIRLVCVQYPMQNIDPLKKIFEKEAKGDIVFVDNERVFKDVVGREGYRAYFIDMFGGNFGHCTARGNELLAGSIANTILKEVFDKT